MNAVAGEGLVHTFRRQSRQHALQTPLTRISVSTFAVALDSSLVVKPMFLGYNRGGRNRNSLGSVRVPKLADDAEPSQLTAAVPCPEFLRPPPLCPF